MTFHVLLPVWEGSTEVTLDRAPVPFQLETIEESVYINVDAEIEGVHELTIACR